MDSTRVQPAPVKLICLGLGRTGVTSLRAALKILGFGPSYCMSCMWRAEGEDFPTWFKIGDGKDVPQAFDDLFRDYGIVADYPAVMYPAELYAAYPDAKFILTTRDPGKWEKSMRCTILRVPEILHAKMTKTGFEGPLAEWLDNYMLGKYHRGRLYTHTQQEILDHNQRVKDIIPPERLLVLDISEGWDRLVEFLEVPKPTIPFPHVNTTSDFEGTFIHRLLDNHM